ncbi:transglycosylase domain-containing protein [Paenibacillus sp. y28]|uniref:transglycosylase domain-containing protein n=1 Tax=Paenibacillus sp. y28 TaxID=3129110 RepID=UPI0030196209
MSKPSSPAQKRSSVRSWTATFISFVGITAALAVLSLLYLRSQALPAAIMPISSQIYDIHGEVIDQLQSGPSRPYVALDQMSPYIKQATLAIEDKRFYDHHGFDLRGITRAVIVNVQSMDKVQGASTISQQLARNLYLSQERTWSRKLKEMVYTAQIEMHWSKDKILEQYLNTIYYGHSTYGIQGAAQLFFGKDAHDLTLAESSLVAGVPKGPRYYSPLFNMQNAKDRQKVILQAMAQQQMITEQEAETAYNATLSFRKPEQAKPSEAPYFRDYIRQQVTERIGMDEELLEEGGIKVYTTLDLNMQHAAEAAVAEQMEGETGNTAAGTGSAGKTGAADKPDPLQVALIAIDPRNGYVKAMIGGRSYADNQYNRVFAASRQPGSAFKPFVYLAALQTGTVTPVTKVSSEPTLFTYDNGRQTYAPSNFAGNYFGMIDLREAIARSDNIYAVHTIQEVGAEKVIDLAGRMGISSPLQPLPSLALGTFPVSPFEMASAFGVIANQGVRVEPTSILRIEDAQGKILFESRPAATNVIPAQYTYILTSLMESVFETGGTASRVAQEVKRPVAGKTGTTNTDAWMVGFTPELATAVWVGHDRDLAISAAESRKAAPIFASFTERALEAVPPKLFPMPEGVVSVYIDPATGKLATDACPGARLEAFAAGTEPTEYCSEHGSAPASPESKEKKQNRSWWEDLKRWWND